MVEEFKRDRKSEVRKATDTNQKYHLRNFVVWTEEIELMDMRELNRYVLNSYKTWRRENYSINDLTLYTNLMTIRALMRWCEDREFVVEGLAETIGIHWLCFTLIY